MRSGPTKDNRPGAAAGRQPPSSLACSLDRRLEEFQATLTRFGELTKLKPRAKPDRHAMVVVIETTSSWEGLPVEGRRLQQRLLGDLRTLSDLLDLVVASQHGLARKRIQTPLAIVSSFVEQSPSGSESGEKCVQQAADALEMIRHQLREMALIDTPQSLLVPDTCALYWCPELVQWVDLLPSPFTLVITGPVLEELDRHKDEHPNDAIRAKATTLTRMIREFTNRGDLHEGVPIVRERMRLRVRLAGARPSQPPEWLGQHADARILVSALELAAEHLASPVALVTRDTGLFVRCQLAGLACLEPPTPIRDVHADKARRKTPARSTR